MKIFDSVRFFAASISVQCKIPLQSISFSVHLHQASILICCQTMSMKRLGTSFAPALRQTVVQVSFREVKYFNTKNFRPASRQAVSTDRTTLTTFARPTSMV
jgi:hypothetical protein